MQPDRQRMTGHGTNPAMRAGHGAGPDPRLCAIVGCSEPADDPRIALCGEHLAIAAEVHETVHGRADLLPEPCALCGSRTGVRYPSGWICSVCEWPHGEHPDGELAPPRIDVVYYLRYRDQVKIGTTVNPRQRFTAIWHDEVLAFERGNRTLEQQRHRQFAADRSGASEWFRLSPAILDHVDALSGGVSPWELWLRWNAEATAVR
jgi:hypothetical protein